MRNWISRMIRRVIEVARDLRFVSVIMVHMLARLWRLRRESKAQLRQDLFVLSVLGFKSEGYFVEFGAADGKGLSNTWLLEKVFHWEGILAEPAKSWQVALQESRSAHLCFDCVWKESDAELIFNEAPTGELSTLEEFSALDRHASRRSGGQRYSVRTISLEDLLDRFAAPAVVDYLSVDTEGSEYEILKEFDWSKYKFNVISCEHNYTENREKVRELLVSKGYVRVFPRLSRFDDWFVHSSLDITSVRLIIE